MVIIFLFCKLRDSRLYEVSGQTDKHLRHSTVVLDELWTSWFESMEMNSEKPCLIQKNQFSIQEIINGYLFT